MNTTAWHGSKNDLTWYDLYKEWPIKVKFKNVSRLGGQPSGTFKVRDFIKTETSNAEFTILHRGDVLTASLDLDNPQTYLDKNYDRQYMFNFYSGSMPVTPRQAFNLMQVQKHSGVKE